MEDDLTRAQRYREFCELLHRTAEHARDEKYRGELTELAGQYERLAARLIGERAT